MYLILNTQSLKICHREHYMLKNPFIKTPYSSLVAQGSPLKAHFDPAIQTSHEVGLALTWQSKPQHPKNLPSHCIASQFDSANEEPISQRYLALFKRNQLKFQHFCGIAKLCSYPVYLALIVLVLDMGVFQFKSWRAIKPPTPTIFDTILVAARDCVIKLKQQEE